MIRSIVVGTVRRMAGVGVCLVKVGVCRKRLRLLLFVAVDLAGQRGDPRLYGGIVVCHVRQCSILTLCNEDLVRSCRVRERM